MELDFKEIEKDLKIDESDLATESIRTPQLHNKYLTLLLRLRNRKDKLDDEIKILRKNKWLYYTGKMSEEELKQLGWEPFELNVLKTEADDLILSDPDWIKLDERVAFQTEKVNYLESIVKIINNRQWQIRAMIDWYKFTQGV